MTTQIDRIRSHLHSGKAITPAQAITVYGIFRLASVIEDLRKAGEEIDTVMCRDEMGKQYGSYRLHRPIRLSDTVQVRLGYAPGLPRWVRSLESSRVIGNYKDSVLVLFKKGKRTHERWMNKLELVNSGR